SAATGAVAVSVAPLALCAPDDSSCVTDPPARAIAALGPSSRNLTSSPILTEFVALSPSPSVTVTTACSAVLAIDTASLASPLVSAVPCFSEAYCAVLTKPLFASIATANAARPLAAVVASAPIRPTTTSPSLNRKTFVPSVVVSPESPPPAATDSEYAFDAPSSSAPKLLLSDWTTAAAL